MYSLSNTECQKLKWKQTKCKNTEPELTTFLTDIIFFKDIMLEQNYIELKIN